MLQLLASFLPQISIFKKNDFQGKTKARRVKTIYDCQADNDDELTFVEGEVIIVTGEEDQEWWVSPHGSFSRDPLGVS